MVLKFVLKNLILVALIAFAMNWLIGTNINLFTRSIPSHGHSSQLEELTQEEVLQQSEALRDPT